MVKKKIEVPEIRRKGNGKFIKVIGAKENNLKNINVKFHLGIFTCSYWSIRFRKKYISK